MNASEIFLADDRLRPIWRFFLSLILLFAAVVMGGELLQAIFHAGKFHPSDLAVILWNVLMVLVATLACFKLMTAVFDHRPFGSIGLAFHPRWWRELGRGLVVGGAMLFLAVGLEWAMGFAQFSYFPHPVLSAGAAGAVLFALGAVSEEAMFRGYPFQRLVDAITAAGAIAVTSAIFGLAHLGNPHKTWISTVNTMLVAIPFAVAYLRTRSLWMPIGMHFIWNFLMDFLLGLPVSGLNLTNSVLTARVHGPEWLTGGDYGPEGSLLATIAILLATVYVAFAKSIYTTEEMKALVFAPAPTKPPDLPMTILSISPPQGEQRD